MRIDGIRQAIQRRRGGVVVLGMTLALSGCGLDKVNIPDLDGPSELALSLRLTAQPDVLTADGHSTSVIEVLLRNENGSPVAGRAVIFTVANESGIAADIGTVENPAGNPVRATEAQATTDGSGVARVIYKSPARTDLTADTNVQIRARPIGTDFNGAQDRFIRIQLRSAEPRLFPPPPAGNAGPSCSFIVEAPGNRAECTAPDACKVVRNTDILFQSTSFDADGTIVRYQWFWGDGSPADDEPDTSHVWTKNGMYTITHIVTDNFGATDSCQATLEVVSKLTP